MRIIRIVRVENLEPGMQLAQAVYSADGKILLNAGVILKDAYIVRLKALGFPAVYIGDPKEAEAIPEAISGATRRRAISTVKESFTSVKFGGTLNLEPIKEVVNTIVDEVVLSRDVTVALTDIRRHDDYTFGHSVNVCVLAIMMGIALEYDDLTLRELAMGAILHDVGKIKIPDQILLKPTRLSCTEWKEMKQHTRYGFEVLRGCSELSTRAAHVAYQHHERMNGGGYPRGLEDNGIHPFARIVAVADTYDAMTSDRVYREGVTPFEALKTIRSLRSYQLDPGVVDIFLANVVQYPPGCKVKLDSGEVGMVVSTKGQNSLVIKVEYDSLGRPLGKPTEIELGRHAGRRITQVF